MGDILRAFHHPALRDEQCELHRNMFNTVRTWVNEQPDRDQLNHVLSSASVKAGRNHKASGEGSGSNSRGLDHVHDHGALGGHGKTSGSIWTEIRSRDLGALAGSDGRAAYSHMSPSPQPSSPGMLHSPQFGYSNVVRPGSSSYDRPTSQGGGYLNSNPPQSSYHSGPPGSFQQPRPEDFNSPFHSQPHPDYVQIPPAGQYPPHGGYPSSNAPYPPDYQQPNYGGLGAPYDQGPPHGPGHYYPGPQGPPPPGWQGGPPQQPPYGNQYPPQQTPYGQYPPQQPPYNGGGGYPGSGYSGGY